MNIFNIVKISEENRKEVNDFLTDSWASTDMVIRGEVIDGTKLEGYVVYEDNKIIGLITYMFYDNICEIVSLDSLKEKQGIGTTLINKVKEVAKENKCDIIRLITTNDNINALGFYQKRGFHLTKLYPNAIDYTRKIKYVPLIGESNIPIRDEIELEMDLK